MRQPACGKASPSAALQAFGSDARRHQGAIVILDLAPRLFQSGGGQGGVGDQDAGTETHDARHPVRGWAFQHCGVSTNSALPMRTRSPILTSSRLNSDLSTTAPQASPRCASASASGSVGIEAEGGSHQRIGRIDGLEFHQMKLAGCRVVCGAGHGAHLDNPRQGGGPGLQPAQFIRVRRPVGVSRTSTSPPCIARASAARPATKASLRGASGGDGAEHRWRDTRRRCGSP